jgi:hypothetical protein
MSALGHKPTCAVQNRMSALPPIATLFAFFVCFGPKADTENDYDLSGSNAAARGKITLISVNSPG